MVGQPYSGKLCVRLDERREHAETRCLFPTLHAIVHCKNEEHAREALEATGLRMERPSCFFAPLHTVHAIQWEART